MILKPVLESDSNFASGNWDKNQNNINNNIQLIRECRLRFGIDTEPTNQSYTQGIQNKGVLLPWNAIAIKLLILQHLFQNHTSEVLQEQRNAYTCHPFAFQKVVKIAEKKLKKKIK